MDQALADLQAGQADLQKRFMLLSTAFAPREAFDTLNSEVQTIGAALVAVQTAQASFGQGQNEILQFVRTIQEAQVAHAASVATNPEAPPVPDLENPGQFSGYARLDKDPQLPTYDGNGDALEFLEQCEECFAARRTHPDGQLTFTRLALRGTARTLVREKKPMSYQALKEVLMGRFKLPNEDFHLTTKLRSLQQQGDNLETYLREFKFLAAKIPSLQDTDKRITFINGLAANVTLEVLRAKPTNFEEAEQAALEYYACRRLTKSQVTFQSSVVHEVDSLYAMSSGRDHHANAGFSPRPRSHSAGSQSSSASSFRSRSPRHSSHGQVNHFDRQAKTQSYSRTGSRSPGRSGRDRNTDRVPRPFTPRPGIGQQAGGYRGGRSWQPRNGPAPTSSRGSGGSRRFQRDGSKPTPMELDALVAEQRAQSGGPRSHSPRTPQGNGRR